MAIINEKELNNGITKISIYKQEEDINLDDFEIMLNELSNMYKTNNNDKLNKLNLELKIKFNKINNIHNGYIETLNKTINKYKDTEQKAENILSNIDTNIN